MQLNKTCAIETRRNYALFKGKLTQEGRWGQGVINLYILSEAAATHNQTEFTTF